MLPALGISLSHLLALEGLYLGSHLVTLCLLTLVSISLGQVDLKAGVNDLVEPLADGDLGLVRLLDGHDPLDFALTLLYSPLHIVIVAAHLPDERLIVLLLADDGRVAAFLDVAVNFESALLI